MTAHNLHSVLQLISQAYPEKVLDPLTLALYLDELADIPVRLLERAAREHIRTSTYFPRIAELRQVAQRIAGAQDTATLAPPGYDFLYAEYRQFVHAHCHREVLDPHSWEQLARKLDRLGRDCFARELREKARFIQRQTAAHEHGEQYPSVESCQRYFKYGTEQRKRNRLEKMNRWRALSKLRETWYRQWRGIGRLDSLVYCEPRLSVGVPRASVGVPRASVGVPRASVGEPRLSLRLHRPTVWVLGAANCPRKGQAICTKPVRAGGTWAGQVSARTDSDEHQG